MVTTPLKEEKEGTLTVHAPGGWWARFVGMDTKILLLALVLTGMFLVAAYEWEQDRRATKERTAIFLSAHNTTQAMLQQVLTTQAAIIDLYKQSAMDRRDDVGEIVYMLSLPQTKRESLRLDMPEKLRRKLNER